MIAPPRLRPGDRIGIVAPSGPVLRKHVAAGVRTLEREGFRVSLARHVFDRRGHLAGTDAARLDDFNRMLRDPDIRCVLLARGGYGSMRISSGIDWRAMRRDPKIFAGFSDATFLHLGFARHAGVRTLHGPNLHGFGFGRPGEIARWFSWVTRSDPPDRVRTMGAPVRIAGSRSPARGIVLGGNLQLVDYAAGTDILPSFRGAIVFFEEVNEPPYKVDGMLCHLRLAGAFRGARAVALGDFYRCVPRPKRRELKLAQVLRDHLEPLGIPAVGGIRAGHGHRNLPVPFGAIAILDPGKGVLRYEEGLVS
ncbi:MAG TPA: LD-carboxypeptidase [Candidatus Eisenbacteria bacterium]|nr:LD-carboxypeptidase [Candidatus Eisenbacteria bacterium]